MCSFDSKKIKNLLVPCRILMKFCLLSHIAYCVDNMHEFKWWMMLSFIFGWKIFAWIMEILLHMNTFDVKWWINGAQGHHQRAPNKMTSVECSEHVMSPFISFLFILLIFTVIVDMQIIQLRLHKSAQNLLTIQYLRTTI